MILSVNSFEVTTMDISVEDYFSQACVLHEILIMLASCHKDSWQNNRNDGGWQQDDQFWKSEPERSWKSETERPQWKVGPFLSGIAWKLL